MTPNSILEKISKGRTDLIINLLSFDNWEDYLNQGSVKLMSWLVYYNDLTAIKIILEKGGNLETISLNSELGNAAFFGHWKICDFLIHQGGDVNYKLKETHETPLHNALCKAGRPYYLYTIKCLVEHGADVNATTIPDKESGSFMRDVRTCGEAPLHRAAAYADTQIIDILIDHGADRSLLDSNGDSPLTWASRHLRPGSILYKLAYGNHKVSSKHALRNTSDHGCGWGNSMDWNLYGEYTF